jgi:tRNA pseudouridine38-40 synthase
LCPIKINQALQCCVGTHDFTSFQHAQCVQNPVRTIESINVRREAGLVRIEFRGRSFVMHQIRRIVGTVVEWVMSGGIRGADRSVSDVLRMQDRRASGQTAPGVGLLLKQILYPGLPEFVADAGDCDD